MTFRLGGVRKWWSFDPMDFPFRCDAPWPPAPLAVAERPSGCDGSALPPDSAARQAVRIEGGRLVVCCYVLGYSATPGEQVSQCRRSE
ncbi:hypothetical protein R5R35_006945 [Gryllus longicercus]|uniref:Uncharacterized protein n=1 Tax=Gryllus longicercus TaxID=2509291 RepID=A0AAN9YW77_9ORTH